MSVKFSDSLMDDVHGECRFSHIDADHKAVVVYGDGTLKHRTKEHLRILNEPTQTQNMDVNNDNMDVNTDAAPAVETIDDRDRLFDDRQTRQVFENNFVKAYCSERGQVMPGRISLANDEVIGVIFFETSQEEQFLRGEVVVIKEAPIFDLPLLRSADFNDVLMNGSQIYDLTSVEKNPSASTPFALMATAELPAAIQSHWGSAYMMFSLLSTKPQNVIDPLSIVVISKEERHLRFGCNHDHGVRPRAHFQDRPHGPVRTEVIPDDQAEEIWPTPSALLG